jgi:hypothetical protein
MPVFLNKVNILIEGIVHLILSASALSMMIGAKDQMIPKSKRNINTKMS